jgi:MarR family 2-MHQ and catechol resistance regulon transcriptional repressor
VKHHGRIKALEGVRFDLLWRLAHNKEGISVKDLAASMNMTSGAVTQLLDTLSEKGLVERVEGVSDRRVVLVKLAPDAKSRFRRLRHCHFENMATIFDPLSDKEMEQLLKLLQKLKSGD